MFQTSYLSTNTKNTNTIVQPSAFWSLHRCSNAELLCIACFAKQASLGARAKKAAEENINILPFPGCRSLSAWVQTQGRHDVDSILPAWQIWKLSEHAWEGSELHSSRRPLKSWWRILCIPCMIGKHHPHTHSPIHPNIHLDKTDKTCSHTPTQAPTHPDTHPRTHTPTLKGSWKHIDTRQITKITTEDRHITNEDT